MLYPDIRTREREVTIHVLHTHSSHTGPGRSTNNTASFRLPKCLCDALDVEAHQIAHASLREGAALPPPPVAPPSRIESRAISSERRQPSAGRGAPPQPKRRCSAPRPLVRRGRRGVSDPSLQTQPTERACRPSLQTEPAERAYTKSLRVYECRSWMPPSACAEAVRSSKRSVEL